MKLTKQQVGEIARLARLKLTPEETLKFAGELTDILEYVDLLRECDTDGVPETSQVTGLSNVQREDEIDSSLCEPAELLKASPLEKQDNQIKIKKMM